jgi:hypothetical protein
MKQPSALAYLLTRLAATMLLLILLLSLEPTLIRLLMG